MSKAPKISIKDFRCDGCPYFVSLAQRQSEAHGECRAHPPVALPREGGGVGTSFPVVKEDDGCGMHPGFRQKIRGAL